MARGLNMQGGLVAVLLIATTALSSVPNDPVGAVVFGFGALWLEREGLALDRSFRFSPAAFLYLTIALCPGLGGGLAAVLILIDSLARLEAGFWANMSQRLAVSLALLVLSAMGHAQLPWPALPLLAGPLVYLGVRLGFESALRVPTTAEEKTVWRQVHQRIRPLEAGLAMATPVFATAVGAIPWLSIGLLPLLASTRLAAENVLLAAHDQSIGKVLADLEGAQSRERLAARALDHTKRQNQLLEGFSQHLAGQHSLESTAAKLVATVFQLMPADNAVIFLGKPPEPFSYRVSEEHRDSLQGAILTGLREPLVEKVFGLGKPALQRAAPEPNADRLLPADAIAAAVPLGNVGVLYVGRQSQKAFTKEELERIKWLAEKATVALEAGYQVNEEARQRRLQRQAVDELERKVLWLSHLMTGAEEMAGTLDPRVLVQRFVAVIARLVPQRRGVLILQGAEPLGWGEPLQIDPRLLESTSAQGADIVGDVLTSRYSNPGKGVGSLLAAPLLARQQCLGVIVLASELKHGFSQEQRDLLAILCAQAALALSNARSHTQVVEARRQLEESQAGLIQSSKLTAIGQLAAGVAHELNSPMGAISLSVDEALHQLEERPQLSARLLVKAQEAVERSRAIIDRLLVYSRKPSHHPQPLSLKALVEDTVEFLAFQLRAAGVTVNIAVTTAEQRFMVVAEEQPLQQVLTNLILNAAQSMEECSSDERSLTLTLAEKEGQVRLEVADQGTGISQEHLERVFDPFFTTKPAGRGTGLGLWASREIVTQHGGTISVTSTPGLGSTFMVVLPGVGARTP